MITARFLLIACSLALSATLAQAETPRKLYAVALTREQAARGVLSTDDPSLALSDVRTVVAAYQALVKQFPSSGYADDALWQAGRLSLDAFERFGQARDKTDGVRLLKSLAAGYPTSKHAKLVPAEIKRVELVSPDQLGQKSTPAGPATRSSSPGGRVTIKEIRRAILPDVVRVIVELDGEAPFHHERLTGPERIFVDISSTRPAPSLIDQTLRFEADADLVRQIRIGRHPNSTTRIVLETAGVSSYSVYALRQPYRIIVDCLRAAVAGANVPEPSPRIEQAAPAAPEVAAPIIGGIAPARATVGSSSTGFPLSRPSAASAIAAALAVNTAPVPERLSDRAIAPLSAPVPFAPPARPKGSTGFTIARQLGLSVSRIVIDPGHGGHDPGAQGKGITEAELVLDVALRLEKLLLKNAGVEVILTRRTDEFVPLQERTAIANREGADLFLSIHANASPNAHARGVETYFLNFANNLSAAAVAARENAASGHAMGALPDFVKAIALNNKLDESRDLATDVQRALVERLRGTNKSVKDLGVKQAPFLVLIGAAMPSVLAEISFVTNAQESKLLRGGAYRQRIAEALFNAVRKYQSSLTDETRIANRRSG